MTRWFTEALVLTVTTCLLLLYFPMAYIWRRFYKSLPRDTSWKFGRELIYSQGIQYWEQKLISFGLDCKNADVLEVGSGNGQWLIAAENLGASSVLGIEPNQEVLSFSQDKLDEYNCHKVEVKMGAAESIQLKDCSVDVVLCLGVFMFTEQDKALNEFKRVIKEGGELVVSVNGLGYFLMKLQLGIAFSLVKEIRYGVHGLIYTFIKWISGNQLGTTAVTISEMNRKFEQFGFELETVTVSNDLPLYDLDYLGYPTNYVFRAKSV